MCRRNLLGEHRSAVVQLLVKGKVDNEQKVESGTGFLIQTTAGPRIVTAGHVVGPDDKWDSLDDRCIYYRLAQAGSSMAYDCVVDAKVEADIDLAEVYLDPFDAPVLKIASELPSIGTDLVVVSWRNWGQPGSKAIARTARVLEQKSDRIVLSGNYEKSDSGSPVLDGNGHVVALMTEASLQPGGTTVGFALPSTSFAAVLSGAIASPITRTPIPDLGRSLRWARPLYAYSGISYGIVGCVFMGKRSAANTNRTSDMPFGAGVLETLSSDKDRESLRGRRLSVQSPVILRSECPTVDRGSAYYAPANFRLSRPATFLPSKIFALTYADDVFYWAKGRAFVGQGGKKGYR